MDSKKIREKIADLKGYSFHNLETDQFMYELKVINTVDSTREKFLCLYVVVVEKFLDINANNLIPLYYKEFESCQ